VTEGKSNRCLERVEDARSEGSKKKSHIAFAPGKTHGTGKSALGKKRGLAGGKARCMGGSGDVRLFLLRERKVSLLQGEYGDPVE